MSFTLPTIAELQSLYLNVAQSVLPTVDVTQLSDYQAKSSGVAGVGARLALDSFILFNASYPQNGDSFGINTQLSALGIPSQFPSSVTTLTVTVQSIPTGKTYNILVGTVLTASDSQNYQVISPDGVTTTIAISSAYNKLYLTSTVGGLATTQEVGAILKFSPPQQPTDNSLNPITNVVVDSVIAGTDEETLSNAVNRLIGAKQTPRNSSSKTDFKTLVIDPVLGVTDAIVLINNELVYTNSTNNANVAIFDLSGSSITNEILNKGLLPQTTAVVFDRSVLPATYGASLQTLLNQNVCGWHPVTNTVITQALTNIVAPNPPFIKVIVTLSAGYSLTSNIFVDGATLSLYQVIQREVRRAICGQPYGATLSKDLLTGAITGSTLPTSSIEQQLDITLGTPTTTGTLGNYLLSRSVLFYTGSTYEYKADLTLNLGIPNLVNDPIAWIYDVSLDPANIYYNILVTT